MEGSVLGFSPWHVDAHFFIAFLLTWLLLYAPGVSSSSYKDSSHIGLGPHLNVSFYLNSLFKDPISKYSYIPKS